MQNQIYSQNLPQYIQPNMAQNQTVPVQPQMTQPQMVAPQPVQPQPQMAPVQYAQPAAGVGAVNIQIFNPTAYSPAQSLYQPSPCVQYPYNYNNMIQQPQMVAPQPVQPQPQQPNVQNINNPVDNTMAYNKANTQDVAAQGEGANGQKTQKPVEKKPTVPLTDDYIKTLENYLNSQDKKIRLTGAKELFERFKEDETRKQDPALTALLNKVLQDPSETVKFIGLTALDSNYAIGNDETAQILTQMQSSNSSYGEDASLASQILLKMSANKAKMDMGQNLSAPSNDSAQAQQNNLNHNSQNQEPVQAQQNNLNQNASNVQASFNVPPQAMAQENLQQGNNMNKLPDEGGVLVAPESAKIQ